MALHTGHFYNDVSVQLVTVRYGLVVGGLRARRPGSEPQVWSRAVRHQRQVSTVESTCLQTL